MLKIPSICRSNSSYGPVLFMKAYIPKATEELTKLESSYIYIYLLFDIPCYMPNRNRDRHSCVGYKPAKPQVRSCMDNSLVHLVRRARGQRVAKLHIHYLIISYMYVWNDCSSCCRKQLAIAVSMCTLVGGCVQYHNAINLKAIHM